MTTIRLPGEIEKKIELIAELKNKTKSDIIKLALKDYLKKYNNSTSSAYEIGKELFGKYGSGESNRSKNYKNILKEKISGKVNH